MLRNTHEVVISGKYKYVVFVDSRNEKEVLIPTEDPDSEFEEY